MNKFKLVLTLLAVVGFGAIANAEMRNVPRGMTGEIDANYGGVDYFTNNESTNAVEVIDGDCSLSSIHFNIATASGNYFVTILDSSSVRSPDDGNTIGKVMDVYYSTNAISNIGGVGATVAAGATHKLGYTHFFRPPLRLKRGAVIRNSEVNLDITIQGTKFNQP